MVEMYKGLSADQLWAKDCWRESDSLKLVTGLLTQRFDLSVQALCFAAFVLTMAYSCAYTSRFGAPEHHKTQCLLGNNFQKPAASSLAHDLGPVQSDDHTLASISSQEKAGVFWQPLVNQPASTFLSCSVHCFYPSNLNKQARSRCTTNVSEHVDQRTEWLLRCYSCRYFSGFFVKRKQGN